ncbi:hypothetical protein RRG08_036064 [Elysia crispata]|uniref:Uncharacterized protein n=1 Tax=Elysia crispata TaxID=231223 RepID=A0AAE1AMC0_9GAST|nr:hypothetical protein RRG08_036064 [Elysia crispata]
MAQWNLHHTCIENNSVHWLPKRITRRNLCIACNCLLWNTDAHKQCGGCMKAEVEYCFRYWSPPRFSINTILDTGLHPGFPSQDITSAIGSEHCARLAKVKRVMRIREALRTPEALNNTRMTCRVEKAVK